ncbi:MAG: hypothetical protein ACO2XZ_01795 [Rickettsiales bacterium]
MIRITILLILLTNCTYKKPLKNSTLIVPPFIQEENPEIYQIFKSE